MTRAIVMAGGSGERWGNHLGVPKQQIVVDGEPLLARTIRLLRLWGITDIVLTGPFGMYDVETVQWSPDNPAADGRLQASELWAPIGRTIVLMGDVWYSEHAVSLICDDDRPEHIFYARFGPSRLTGKPWAEGFADSFWPEHHAACLEAVERAIALQRLGVTARASLWEFWMLEHGVMETPWLLPGGFIQRVGTTVEIDDWTEDFDYPVDYDRWIAAREKVAHAIPA